MATFGPTEYEYCYTDKLQRAVPEYRMWAGANTRPVRETGLCVCGFGFVCIGSGCGLR